MLSDGFYYRLADDQLSLEAPSGVH